MILTHGANSMSNTQRVAGFANIGGRAYPFAKFGTQLWIVENLDYAPSGISLSPPLQLSSYHQPVAWYYNNDASTYGQGGNKFGLLYNKLAVRFFVSNSQLLDGFRVPSIQDYKALSSFLGGDSVSAMDLKSKIYWNGRGKYIFNAPPAGECSEGVFKNLNTYFIGWASDIPTDGQDRNLTVYFDSSSTTYYSAGGTYAAWSIRLVKDVT